jgi:hypothetical protein
MSAGRTGRNRALMFSRLVFGTVLLAGLAGADKASAAETKNAKVTAVYSINFNGMGVGEFTMNASIAGERYTLNADARISVLAGLIYDWHGITSSNGRVINRGPLPATYSFGYETSDKGERINIKFSDNVVREVAINPPQRPSGARIPVTRQHLQNVVDPLTAVLILANAGGDKTGADVCDRRLPVFDGKSRYDIQLSYKRTKQVKSGEGYKGPAYVCKVKYFPIAGHKANDDENGYAAKNDSIEVWMIPISQSGLYVPYYIYIPTPVGVATLSSTRFDVTTPGGSKRARVEAEVE